MGARPPLADVACLPAAIAPAFVRVATVALGALALAAIAAWIADGAQLPGQERYVAALSPVAVILRLFTGERMGALALLLVGSIVWAIALAAGLALLIAARSPRLADTQALALALACLAAAFAALFVVATLPPFAAWIAPPAPDRDAIGLPSLLATQGVTLVVATAGFALQGIGLWLLVRFWLTYPAPADLEEVHRRGQERLDASVPEGRSLFLAWRRRMRDTRKVLLPKRCTLMADTGSLRKGGLGSWLLRMSLAGAGLWWAGTFAAAILVGVVPARLMSMVASLTAPLALMVGFVAVQRPIECVGDLVAYHADSADDGDRRRVEWLRAAGAFAYHVAFYGYMYAWLLVTPLMLLFPEAADRISNVGMVAGFILPLTLIPTLLLGALGASILARGLVDPRLALRKVSLWTIVGLGVTFVFVLVERFLALELVRRLGLPAESGAILAGAAVATTFVPMRRAAEQWVNRFVERTMPARLLATGDRHVGAVAVVDISGFTALSARDEQAALLATTLLQKEARRLAEAHEGRVVKFTGDGAMLAFADAPAAAAALRELHAAFARGAEALALPPLPLHSGLHWGEYVDVRGTDIYGHTVNLASRLAEAAAAGEILATDTLVAQLGTVDPPPVAAGTRELKNVPGPVTCLRL